MKRVVIIAALALLALPAAAEARLDLRSYRIWDAGSVLRERWVVCVDPAPGREHRIFDRTVVEMEDGADRRTYNGRDWYGRGCWVERTTIEDTLEYRGWYYGRVRLRNGFTGEIAISPWKRFWSS